MPFAVFRQHQRKLLAVFAIMAMIGFVLSDTLPRWMNSGGLSDRDLVVADIYHKKIHLSDLARMNEKRQRANRFMYYTVGEPSYFGGSTRAELIDALILEHEADRLNIPATSTFARDWIDRETSGMMTPAIFDNTLSRFEQRVGGEQLLSDIAGQVRIALARREIAVPVVTPLDVFRNYRDQTERASFKVIPVVVDSFTGKVLDPTDAEIKDYYEKYKDVLPDPASPTPGFKIPRQVKAEYLAIDAEAVARRIEEKITDDELKAYYEGRKKEFPVDTELPVDLFMGAPELTPARYVPLSDPNLHENLNRALARDKANEELRDTFDKVLEESVDKFSEEYYKAKEEIEEAKKDGFSTEGRTLPKPNDLAGVAGKYKMTHEVTTLMDRAEADKAGRVSLARAGSGLSSDPRNFAAVLFDPKTQLFDGFELADPLGQRYLIRKVEDIPAHVAALEEIRDQVARAWKREQARPLALKAAEELAGRLKTQGGQIKELSIDNRPVISVDSVTKLKRGMPIPSRSGGQYNFEFGPPTPTDLIEIKMAGQPLLDTLFALKPGEVAIEPDQPRENYYVLTLDKRDPVPFMTLMGPNGSLASYRRETQEEMMRKSYTEGMERLREQAGYRPQDYPTEAQDREAGRES
jgi:hypothetical protein